MANTTDHREMVTIWIACIITAVWVVAFLADMFVDDYETPPIVMPVMLLAAGYLFTADVMKRKDSNKDD